MAEKCPYCGSTNVSTTGLGYVEKTAKGAASVLFAGVGKIGRALKHGGSGNATGIGGALVDQLCSGVANATTKHIPTSRKCNCCGRTFHSTPDKGWYD